MESGNANAPYSSRPLYRSRDDRLIAGVCGGLAERYGWDPTLVRLAAVAAALVSGGGIVIAYIVAAIVIPEEPEPGFRSPDSWYSQPWDRPASEGVAPSGPGPAGSAAASEGPAPTEGPAPETAQQPAPATPPYSRPPAPYAHPPRIPRGSRSGGVIVGGILVLFGLLLLFGRFFAVTFAVLWPLVFVAIGLLIIFGGGRRDDRR